MLKVLNFQNIDLIKKNQKFKVPNFQSIEIIKKMIFQNIEIIFKKKLSKFSKY